MSVSGGELDAFINSMGISGSKMEVPAIYKAYFLGLCKAISP